MAKVETMPQAETKVPVTVETKPTAAPMAMQVWRPFENLRREIDRMFEEFSAYPFRLPLRRPAFDIEPFWQPETWVTVPAIDFVETDKAYELTADFPGLDEKDVEVKVANGVLTVKAEKNEEKEETKKDFHLRERRFGAYERSVRMPEGVDVDKIEASFKKGVLTVKLPKTADAQKAAKAIPVKAAA